MENVLRFAKAFSVGTAGRPPSPSTTLLRALSSADPLSSSVETSPPPSPPQPSAFRSAQYEDGSGYLHPQHSQPLTPELPSCLQPWDRPPYAVHPHWEDAARKSLHERDWPGGTCSTNGTAGFLPWEDSVLRHQSSGRVMDAVTFWDLGPGQFAVRGGTERERERSLRSWDGTRGNPGAPVAGPGPAPGWRSPRESIVSLLPSGTEILFALGLGNRWGIPAWLTKCWSRYRTGHRGCAPVGLQCSGTCECVQGGGEVFESAFPQGTGTICTLVGTCVHACMQVFAGKRRE